MQHKGEVIAIVDDELSITMELMIWIQYLDKFQMLSLLLFFKIRVIGISPVVQWLKLSQGKGPGLGPRSAD